MNQLYTVYLLNKAIFKTLLKTLLKHAYAKKQMLFIVYYVISFREGWYKFEKIWKIGSRSVKLTVSRKENWWEYNNLPCLHVVPNFLYTYRLEYMFSILLDLPFWSICVKCFSRSCFSTQLTSGFLYWMKW